MSNEFKEHEYKYSAEGLDFETFKYTILEMFPWKRKLTVAGYDDYFSTTSGEYLRHRYNADHAELTVKRRLSLESTAERVEVDVAVVANQPEQVAALAKIMGYEKDFSIYKICHIYWTDTFNIVFYLVYNTAMNERSRFVEIEAAKGVSDPLAVIEYVEFQLGRHFKQIGSDKRLNKSMYELYTTRGNRNA